jgi:hypothetical protein
MEEAADPSVKDIFRYKIPASFIPVRGAPIMSPMRLPSHANWASFCRDDKPAVARDSKTKLREGQNVFDAPAAANRAFHGRLDNLKTFLRQRFGGLLQNIGMVGFQKRGPHAWIVVKFNTEPPLSALDLFISAEILTLDDKVQRYYLNSRDHPTHPGSRCNRNNRCIYDFPQPMTPPYTYAHLPKETQRLA